MSKVVSILFPFCVFPLLLVHIKERLLFSAVFAFRKQPPFKMICLRISWTAVLYQKCVRSSALYLYLSRDHHGLRAVCVPVYHAVRHTGTARELPFLSQPTSTACVPSVTPAAGCPALPPAAAWSERDSHPSFRNLYFVECGCAVQCFDRHSLPHRINRIHSENGRYLFQLNVHVF